MDQSKHSGFRPDIGYFIQEITAEERKFHRRRRRFRISVLFSRIAVAALGAATTIVLGLGRYQGFMFDVNTASAVAIVLSGLVAFLATMEAFLDHGNLWIECSNVRRDLEALKRRIRFSFEDREREVDERLLQSYFCDFENIMRRYNENWVQSRSTQARNGQPSPGEPQGVQP